MYIQISDYIDFGKLFDDLYEYHEESMKDSRCENDVSNKILLFKDSSYKEFELMIDECDYGKGNITFVYGYDFGDANESNPQSSTANYVIVYNSATGEFTSCDYEQG